MNLDATTASSVPSTNTTGVHCESYIREISAALNLLTGLPLNSYMLWLIITDPAKTIVSCFLEINMALCEILFIVLSPLALMSECKYLNVPKSMQYVRYLCYATLLTGRPMLQTLSCIERYVAVVHPVVFRNYGALRYKFKYLTVGWFMALTVCLIMSFYGEKAWYALIVQTLILIMVKLFCFLSVLRALKQPKPGDGGRDRETANQAKMRAVKIILILLISAIVQYIPLLLVWLLYLCLPQLAGLKLAADIIFFIMAGSGFIQPVLFLQRTRKFPCKGTP